MLERNFQRVYNRFKLSLYARIFKEDRDGGKDSLTTQEVISMEIINCMNEPTVNEFAAMATLSAPNAAYRVNQLVKKGYIEKVQSDTDKREFHLRITPKYEEDYGDIFYRKSRVLGNQPRGGSGSAEEMLSQDVSILLTPPNQRFLLVVVSNQRNPLLQTECSCNIRHVFSPPYMRSV